MKISNKQINVKSGKKTVLISGNTNGLGLAIALSYAKAGAEILVFIDEKETFYLENLEMLRSYQQNIKLQHISTKEENIIKTKLNELLGPVGKLDVLINHFGSEFDIDTSHIHPQQFDSMYSLNVRNTFMLSKLCHPFLKRSDNPHIINVSPPLDIDSQWFKSHLAFSLSTYGMSMCTLGMAAEFKKNGIAVNSIWPSAEKTNAFKDNKQCIDFANAIYSISLQRAKKFTGNFCKL